MIRYVPYSSSRKIASLLHTLSFSPLMIPIVLLWSHPMVTSLLARQARLVSVELTVELILVLMELGVELQ